MTWRQIRKLLSLRRLSAGLLLFLLVGDLALHVGESYLEDPPAGASDALAISAQNPHADESNCPIPGHSGGRFHHHHYPGVITSQSVFTPVSLRRIVQTAVIELSGSALLVTHPGRAPPSFS